MQKNAKEVFDECFEDISRNIAKIYSSESHYQAIVTSKLIDNGLSLDRMLIDSWWIVDDWDEKLCPPSSGIKIDIVVFPEPPSKKWYGHSVFCVDDFRRAEFALEIKRYGTNLEYYRRDLRRLSNIRHESNGVTDVAMLLIDDKSYLHEKKREYCENNINRAIDYAEELNVPLYRV